MAKRRRRRKWSDDEKRMICSQTRVPGVSVAQVARRYDVNANQVFNWLKESRFASDDGANDKVRFLPVEIVEDAQVAGTSPAAAAGLIELDLASGHRLRIRGSWRCGMPKS